MQYVYSGVIDEMYQELFRSPCELHVKVHHLGIQHVFILLVTLIT